MPQALGAAGYVVAWIELSGRGSGPLLLPVNKGDAIQDRRLSPEAIGLVVQRLARDAGLPPATAHDFRRTLIGDLLDAGADLATVQQLAGHASPTTTARYDRRPAEARRRAARMVRVPGPTLGKRRVTGFRGRLSSGLVPPGQAHLRYLPRRCNQTTGDRLTRGPRSRLR